MQSRRHAQATAEREGLIRERVDAFLANGAIALTYISLAEKGGSSEAVRRYIEHARRTYEGVQSRRSTVPLSDLQRILLDSKLIEVRRRLGALGEKL